MVNIISKKLINELNNNAVVWKNMKKLRKHRDIKVATTNKAGNFLVSELNYQIFYKIFFSKDLSVIEMKNRQIFLNKYIYLGLLTLEIRKIIICNYRKPKYRENEKKKNSLKDTGRYTKLKKTKTI